MSFQTMLKHWICYIFFRKSRHRHGLCTLGGTNTRSEARTRPQTGG